MLEVVGLYVDVYGPGYVAFGVFLRSANIEELHGVGLDLLLKFGSGNRGDIVVIAARGLRDAHCHCYQVYGAFDLS